MYAVNRISEFGEITSKEYKTSWGAVRGWLNESRKHPFEVAIDATTKDEVIELRKLVKKYKEWFSKCHEEAKNPYKAEYLLEQVNEPEKLEGCEFDMNLPSYPCVPFTVG